MVGFDIVQDVPGFDPSKFHTRTSTHLAFLLQQPRGWVRSHTPHLVGCVSQFSDCLFTEWDAPKLSDKWPLAFTTFYDDAIDGHRPVRCVRRGSELLRHLRDRGFVLIG